jgi:hypothetical protein
MDIGIPQRQYEVVPIRHPVPETPERKVPAPEHREPASEPEREPA